MRIEPKNRHLLLAACEEPRKTGIIEGIGQSLFYAYVEAVDETVTNHVADVGDVVYWAAGQMSPSGPVPPPEILLDNNLRRWLLPEHFVLGVVRSPGVKLKATVAQPASPIAMPNPAEVNAMQVARRREQLAAK